MRGRGQDLSGADSITLPGFLGCLGSVCVVCSSFSPSENHSESECFLETWIACPGIARNPDMQEVIRDYPIRIFVGVGTRVGHLLILTWLALSHRHPVQQVHDELHEPGGGAGQCAPL